MNQFKNKTAIITGGASGMGRALAELLAAKGATVVIVDINADKIKEVTASLMKQGGVAEGAVVNVTDATAIQQLIDSVVKKYGHLDYIFNNAGIAIGGDARDLSIEQWQKVLDINLNGAIYGTVSAYKVMAKQGSGHIINTASATGLVPQPGNTPYATSKHGIVGMSLSLRAEGADLGIKVSTVCPGYVQTDIYKNMEVTHMSREKAASRLPDKAVSAQEAAQIILDGVAKNEAIIIFPKSVAFAWKLNRWFPKMMESVWVKRMRDFRQYREE